MASETISIIDRILNTAAKTATVLDSPNTTLFDSTKPYRVEPFILIESSMRDTDHVKALVPHLLSVFAGAYVQTVNVLGANVSAVESIRFLDAINPDRNMITVESADLVPLALDSSSYKYGLPDPTAMIAHVDLENNQGNGNVVNGKIENNLTVGREVLVVTGVGEQSRKHTINFRAIPMTVHARSLINFFSSNITGNTLRERWASVKDGRISFWADFIFCRDVIADYKKSAMLVNEQSISKVKARRNKALAITLVNRRLSLAAASSFYIISKATANAVEAETGVSFDKEGHRDRYMDQTAAMGIIVVDEDWSRVKFYYKGIAAVAELTFNEIKNMAKKDSSGEIFEQILSAMKIGGNPSAF